MPQKHAILTINIPKIVSNYNILSKKCVSGKVAAVVKANAYGLGVKEVAEGLQKAGCNSFFVAHLHEAIELRKILPKEKIFVFHGVSKGEEKTFTNYNIIPVLNTFSQIQLWQKYSAKSETKHSYALHFDTGMNRLGFAIDDCQLIKSTIPYSPELIISHLACADEKDNQKNSEQLQEFNKVRKFYPNIPSSLANSSGMFLGKKYQFDLARPGIALYGGNPTSYTKNPMCNVIKLTSRILQIHHIDRVSTVGYGATHKLKVGSKIATIPIGYADGYFRSLSNKGVCAIAGKIVPVIGRISMDLISIDVTSLADNLAHEGSEVEIIGDNVSVDILAKKADTISYEILTSLGNRYKRVYV